jgi:hypothetical protein
MEIRVQPTRTRASAEEEHGRGGRPGTSKVRLLNVRELHARRSCQDSQRRRCARRRACHAHRQNQATKRLLSKLLSIWMLTVDVGGLGADLDGDWRRRPTARLRVEHRNLEDARFDQVLPDSAAVSSVGLTKVVGGSSTSVSGRLMRTGDCWTNPWPWTRRGPVASWGTGMVGLLTMFERPHRIRVVAQLPGTDAELSMIFPAPEQLVDGISATPSSSEDGRAAAAPIRRRRDWGLAGRSSALPRSGLGQFRSRSG